ncbi:DUF5000 domain-containing lipoprotein [Parapedobacter pyrenivorans]|uniref:DUF5000 domain-containing lipoprotein n=1 Tax=Parapedobacter pyrenivorans TaxID=1305674 RepID=UPI00333F3E5C
MKTFYYIYILVLCGAVSLNSCKEEGRLDHLDSNAPAPGQVSNVKIESLPGEVVLTYDQPNDYNLAYVQAVYEIKPGVVREAKASVYSDTLKLDGFGDTQQYRVQIFSVGKNEKKSAPVVMDVAADTPPVKSVFETITLTETFGGATVRFENQTRANFVLYMLVDTTGQGDWAPANTFYTSTMTGRYSVRGYEPEERNFAVYIQDRWENKSDTLFETLTPLFEEEIPKNSWTNMKLPTDTWESAGGGYPLEQLWNGAINWNGFASSNSSTLPQHFTINLGQDVLLSRFKIHQFYDGAEHFYNSSALKKFELYGSNSPDPGGGWENWQLLGTFDSFKPSGLPRGQHTQEDVQYGGIDGEDFEFEEQPPVVRYLRLRSLESYSSAGQVTMGELTLFGRVE